MLDLVFSSSQEDKLLDYVAIGQKIDGGLDERVVLLVKLPKGHMLTVELEKKIKHEIRARRSPRHVPARVRHVLFMSS